MRMREGAEIARAPSLGDWGSPLGGSSTHGTPSSLRAVSPLPRGSPLLERSLRVAGHPWVMPEMGPLIYASLPRLYAAPPPSQTHHVCVPLQRRFPAQIPRSTAVQADERAATVVAGELAICREACP